MEDSIFTKIIKGEIPSHKVYEDERTIAFLPLRPIAKGHVLVVPKAQIDQFFDLPSPDYEALMATVQKIAKHMQAVLGTKRVGLQVVGLDVPHAHIHVVAFDTADEYYERHDQLPPLEPAELQALADKLRMEDGK